MDPKPFLKVTQMPTEEMITITKKEYDSLLRADAELSALHAGGVDNWEWYHESLKDAGFFDDDEETEEEIYGRD